ncbi:MAG: 50S ribosomal protein L25 [Patescibacteria group bacterium]|nr:50S ribosomal protein L25 [Patescibacteria group bacterium]
MPTLKVKSRKIFGKKVKKLRKAGLIPAILYGHGKTPQAIEVEKIPFEKIFKQTGESTLIDLIIDDQLPVKALIHDIQYDPLTEKISHIDFYQVKEKEKVTVEVDLKFLGEAPAVKEKGGILVHQLTKIKIECLPKDLIHEIEVDLSLLRELNDLIRIKDLKTPTTIRVLHNLEDVVVSVSAPKVEKEEIKGEEVVSEGKEETSIPQTPGSKKEESQ